MHSRHTWLRGLSSNENRRPIAHRRAHRRPSLETLEDRLAPALLIVNSLADTSNSGGVLTVRDAMLVENGTLAISDLSGTEQAQISGTLHATGGDTVEFTTGLAGQTISLTTFDDTTFGNSAFLVNSQVTVQGDSAQGITIARDTNAADYPGGQLLDFRLFNVATTGNLTLQNVNLAGGLAQGGNGSDATGQYGGEGGGGAAGLGGAVFNQGTLTLTQSIFSNNAAIGGGGGTGAGNPPVVFGGGGGGVGGDAGGGGGNESENGGSPNGGAGGQYPNGSGNDAAAGSPGGFGGGGGAGGGVGGFGSHGADGGFGGGGGAGGGGQGGAGGFGGGGGGGAFYGFSGGGPGAGGFGAGAGANGGGGGGGAGLGGAIFNAAGTLFISNSTLTGNTAQGGTSNGAGNGSGFGGAVFNLNGSVTLSGDDLHGNTVAAGTGGAGGSADAGDLYTLGLDSVLASAAGGSATIGTASGAVVTFDGTDTLGNGTGGSNNFVSNNSTVNGQPNQILWIGAAGDDSFQTPANWNTDQVPTAGQNVVVSASGITITSSAAVSVSSIQSQAALDITAGRFEVTAGASAINAALTVAPGASLTATGAGTSFTATGTTTIDGASLYAGGGATLSLPNATSFDGPNGSGNWYWEATGTGSTLSLPNLTTIANLVGATLVIEASQGGHIGLAALNSTDGSRPVVISADGSSSQIDLSALTTFDSYNGQSYLDVTNGGTVLAAKLTSFSGVNIGLDGTGTIATDQWQAITNGALTLSVAGIPLTALTDIADTILTINGGAYALPGLTNISQACLEVNNGASLTLSGVTSFAASGGNLLSPYNQWYWTATGTGSTLSLPNLTTIASLVGAALVIEASQGGHIDLAALNSTDGSRPVVISADGSGSEIDLSALTTFDSYNGQSYLDVTNSGTVLAAKLTSFSGVNIGLDGTGTIATDQWQAITNGALTLSVAGIPLTALTDIADTILTINGGAYALPGLTNINQACLEVNNGASLTLSGVTSFAASGGNLLSPYNQWYWTATGTGSTLSLPNLTTIANLVGAALVIEASQGGHIDLAALNSTDGSRPVVISADGSGSEIDLSALTTFDSYNGQSYLDVTNSGTVLAAKLTSFSGVSIGLDGTGTIATDQWQAITNGALTLSVAGIPLTALTDIADTILTINGGAYALPGLTNINQACLEVNNGASLTLSGVTNFAASGGNILSPYNQWYWTAAGTGSTLSLPNLTTIANLVGATLVIEASPGGQIDLAALNSTDGSRPVVISADGSSSEIDLSALTTFDSYNGQSYLDVTNSGTVLAAKLTSFSGVSIGLDGTGTIATDQWQSITNGALTLSVAGIPLTALTDIADTILTINGGAYVLPGLTNISQACLEVNNGASLTLSGVTSFAASGGNLLSPYNQWYWTATGTGSTLSLPNLTTIANLVGAALVIEASQGGHIGLAALNSTDGSRPVVISADGSGSEIDLSALTGFNGYYGQSQLNVTNSGKVQLTSGTLNLTGVTVTVANPGPITVGTLNVGTGSVLNAAGPITGNLINGGSVSPNGQLAITGTYTETSAGTLNIALGGGTAGTQYDQLIVNSAATLGGRLNVSLTNSFAPTLDNTFQIMTFASSAQYFSSYSGLNLGNDLELDPSLTATTLTLTTNPLVKIALTTAPQTLLAGQASQPITLQLQDQNGNPAEAGAGGVIVILGTNSSGGAFLDANGQPLPISAVTFAAGTAALSFEYEDTVVGLPTIMALAPSGSTLAQQETVTNSFTWTGAAGDYSFQNPANWNLDRVPGALDHAIISATGITITSSASVTVLSIQSQAALDITSGSFQVTSGASAIDAALTTAAGASLTATGAGTSFTASGMTGIDDANISANSGATLSLPGVTSYANEVDSATTLSASGTGSVLSLPNLASMTATTDADYFGGAFSLTQVQALAGGDVEMPDLTQISGGPIQLTSDGAGSVLNISALASFTGVHSGQGHDSTLQATNSGDVKDNHLATLGDVDLTLDGTGTFSYSQLTSFTGATLNLPAGTFTFGQLTDADGSTFPSVNGLILNLPAATSANGASFTVGTGATLTLPVLTSIDDATFAVSGGATVSLPGVTSYANEVDSATTLSASGTGSLLSLPKLASITATTNGDYYGGAFSLTQVQALAGGDVEMPALTQISGGPIQLASDGTGSVLNISALASFTGVHSGQGHDSTLQATNSGAVKDNSLATLGDVDLTLDGTGTFSYSQLTSFTGALLTLPAETFTFGNLTDADGSTFPSVNGLTLNLPAATSANGASFTVGAGETVTLPVLTSIDDATFAVSGGATVSLPGVTSYANEVDSATTLSASGTGSLLSLPKLASITATTNGDYYGGAFSLTQVQALAGGDVEMPALTQISGGPIQLASDGTGSVLNISALASFTGVHSGQGHDSTLQATNSGAVKDNHLATLGDVDLTLDGTDMLAIAQLTIFTGATLTSAAGSLNFSALTDVDGSNFPSVSGLTLNLPDVMSARSASFNVGSGMTLSIPLVSSIDNASFVVSGGSKVNLPRVTSYTNNINGVTTLSASGTGSVLSLPALATLSENSDDSFGFHNSELTQVEALVGGDVEMTALTQISGGPIQLTSDGSGSVLNVAVLSSFTGVNNGFPNQSELQATNGGTLNDDSLITLVYVNGILPPRPDLVPSAISAPASALPLQSVTVNWTLTNDGNADAIGPWTEQVLVATDAAGDNPTLVEASEYAGPLVPNQPVNRSATVQLPNLAPGNYWLVVRENPFGEVLEAVTANNTAVSSAPTNVAGSLTLVLANHSVSDGAGASVTTATVTRNTDTSNPLVVTLSNSNTASVLIPQTVTIAAGQTSVAFPVGTINPGIVVGTQTATLTASATALDSGSDTLTVTDVNVSTLTLTLGSHSIDETTVNPATTGTITRNTSTASALVVSLLSNAINKLTVPASVTIPAGQSSVTFPVTVIDDNQIDGNATATVTAASAGYVTGSDSAVVIDDNSPTLTLALAQQTVSEAAGQHATTGTVSIASAASQPITIALSSSDISAATVPATVVIGAGQTSVDFQIAAIDDGLDTSDKTAIISANVESNAGVIVTQGSAVANLLLKEADGPALTVSFSQSVVNKGSSATATITRNTDTTAALVVSLTSSDTTKATVPATVMIPADQDSVSFSVTTINDHTPDGLQQVQITASAAGLDTGIATLGISDVDLPDLVVSSVSAPVGGYDNAPLPISWTVTNSGQYPASGSWLDQIYLDPVGGPQSTTPADTVPFTGTVNAGKSYTQTDTLSFPSTVGSYTVRVVADAGDSLQELSFSNNTGVSQPLNDQPAYQVTISTTAATFSNDTPIPLSGVATLTSNGAPAADVPVAVQIMVAGTTRTLTATTGTDGHYSITFQPLQNEAGEYSVAASDPGVTNPPVQVHFEIVGMNATPASANVKVVPNTPLTGQFTLTNLSSSALTGLTAIASGGPAGLNVQLTPPSQIAADGTATLAYSIDATSAQAANGVVTIQVASSQGALLDILVEVTVLPLAPDLVTNPGFLDSGMLVGGQSTISFTVSNNGGAPSGNLQVSLPSTSYLSLASAATISSLAPGASSTVTLELSPPADLPLEEYTGTLAVSNGQTGVGVPFTFTAITSAVGSVHVLVDDDYTFDEAGSPHVQGATVNLLNPYDNTQVVATATTDATGTVTFNNIPAGPYDLQVQAAGHSTYNSSYTVVAGITNNDEVFIARQFVSYTFVVQQTTIQDTYQIQLQTEFQTDVPAPVVTITAPSAIPTLEPGQSGTFNVTITNHGLIAAQGVTLNLPTDAEYTFTALTTQIGVLPAESSVVVPVTVTRTPPLSLSVSDGGTVLTADVAVPNPVSYNTASTVYVHYSNTGSVAIAAPMLVLTALQDNSQGAFLALDSSLASLPYNSAATPAGFSSTVQFLASGATPGVLEPGESETVPVYYAGWLSSQWDGAPVTFNLTEVGTHNTQVIDWSGAEAATDDNAPDDDDSTGSAGLRLPSMNEGAWDAITPTVTANLGSTWGQYVQTLDNDAGYLNSIGEPTNDISQLLTFEVEKANAAYASQTLTSVTADNLPAPGLNLAFVQSFQQSIDGRYSQGILGFGWTTNWDISATTLANGDAVINDDGTSDYFTMQPDGSFAAQQGMTLTASNGAYKLVAPDGLFYQFNVDGSLNYLQDTNGNRITAGYNDQGQLGSLTDSNGEYLDLTYNTQGHLSQLTDSNDQTEIYGYDPAGQYLTSYADVGGTTNYTYITNSSLAQDNALAGIAYANNTQVYFTYDAQGRLIDQHENGGANDETITYLSPGGYVTTDGNGNKTTTYFDMYGDTAETIDPLGNVTKYQYDANLHLTRVIAPGGLMTSYGYDANGNVISETDPLGNTTSFKYDANDNLTSYTDAKGNTTKYAYDGNNNLLSVTFADGTSKQYSYNPLGEATGFLNANGDAIDSTYNAEGLVTQETFADGTSYRYTYNSQSNVTSATDAQGNVTTFVYGDAANPKLLTEVNYPDGTSLSFTYDTVGQRTQSVDQTGFTVNYAYDALGQLSELTDGNGNLIVQYLFDNAGNLIQKNNGNGTFTVYVYDADNRVLSITNYAPSTGTTGYDPANSAVNSFDNYAYDPLDDVLTDTNQDGQWAYTYDGDGQMTHGVFTPNGADPDGLTSQDLQYVYDAAGNRISETVNGVVTTYAVNNMNEYTSSATVGLGTTMYQYDADGNLVSATDPNGNATNFTFNALDQLTAVSGPGTTASYAYNVFGNLISQTISGATMNFQVDPNGNLVAAFSGNGVFNNSGGPIAHYTYGLGIVSQVTAGGVVGYYDFNITGSTIGITAATGAYAAKYAYLPFGQTLTVSGGVSNPFTFVGQFGVMSDVAGMSRMGVRMYNPQTGQFLSNDPLGLAGGDTNIRRYVYNNPTNDVDPLGLSCGYFGRKYIGPGFGPFYHDHYFFGATKTYRLRVGPGQNVPPGVYYIPVTNIGYGPGGWPIIGAFGGPGSFFDEPVSNLPLYTQATEYGYYDDDSVIQVVNQYQTGRYFLGFHDCQNVGDYIRAHAKPCPPMKPPTPDNGPDDQPCTLVITGTSFYVCGLVNVTSHFTTPISIPFRDCSSKSVQAAVAGAETSVGGNVSAGGGGGTLFAILATYNCNPQINNAAQQAGQAKKDAGDPPIDTTPPVTGTEQAASAAGPPNDESPATFIATALGNLGLINGQGGNDNYTAAQAAQVPSTIATFDQTEADLAGIFATAAGNGASLGITGDLNLLHTINSRLQAVTTAENLLFGGDANWLDTQQTATLQQWLTAFFTDVQGSSDGTISAADMTQLLATTLPSNVSISQATEFIDRWNRTVQYWGQGIYSAAQVPAGQSTDFLDLDAIQTAFNAAVTAEQESQVDGYSDVGAEVIANLSQVQTDLTGMGVCATVKLQIDQTATLSRSAFTGTLSLTNSEGTGSLSNVVMNITITDSQGNPANGEFFVSSPSYSGAFSVVNGNATLPDNSTGTVAFTFIPDDSAAPTAPTLYDIGGTIGFTDPAGGAISIPVFPATITVLPQAQLQVNYFLQQTVIGADPFNPQEVIPSEPAILGVLVTNTGAGTANDLTIATAKPQIIQNDKGLLVNFQIIGTQVGTQQVTPSLTVDFGNIAPGQTGDADFLLTSSLQGTFTDFTATFTHSDALGGLDTSLIKSVQTHTLIHAGDFNFPGSTGEIDYLTEETANIGNLPDTIYFSDGTTAPVNSATDISSSPDGTDTYTVTASVTSGWDYLQLPDPGAGYTLSKVVRSDGTVVPVSDQAWTTDRTITDTGKSMVDNELHILDFDSTGSYTVYYAPKSAVAPTVAMTAPADGSVSSNNEPTLSANVADNSGTGLASVQFQYSSDGGMTWINAGPAQTSAPFLFTFGSALTPGTYEARVTATDNTGNSANSNPVSFTILTAPMVTSSTASVADNAVSLSIAGHGFDTNPANDSVAFDNGVTGAVTGATPTSLTVSLSGLSSLTGSTALHASVTVDGVGSGNAVQVATVTPVVSSSIANLPANATTYVINGAGFDTAAANDHVTLSSGTAIVTTASATSLTISVSALASGDLFATINADGVTSGSPVQVATVAPVITASSANLAANTTSVTINGYGFDTNSTNDSIIFDNGVTGTVTSATLTSLTVSLRGLSSLTGGTTLHAGVAVDGIGSGSPVQVGTIAPVVTAGTANLPASATSLTINGIGFDKNIANDSVSFDNGVTGTVTSATETSMTISLMGLSALTAGTALHGSAIVDGIASGSALQVATVAPVITSSTASLPANATSVTISGQAFDAVTTNDSITFDNGVTGSITAANLTALTVSVSGLSSLTAGTALHASVTVDGAGNGSAVQVATVAPVVTPETSSLPVNATSLTINGLGFDTNMAADSVTFDNGVTGTVTAATLTSVTVSLSGVSSLTAGTALHASVNIDGVGNASMLQVATVAPVVTAQTAYLSADATSIVIYGSGFDTSNVKNVVTLSSGITAVAQASATTLIVFITHIVGGSLFAVVRTDGIDSGSPVEVADIVPVVVPELTNLPIDATSLMILGDGFDTDTTKDSISFDDGVTGTVNGATLTSLSVSLSGLSAVTGGTVLHARVTVDGTSNFISVPVATFAPVVTSASTSVSADQTTLVINGSGFDKNFANNTVTLSSGSATVTGASATSLTVSVSGLIAGNLLAAVNTNGTDSGSSVQVATVSPVVTLNTALLPPTAASLTILGSGFDPNAAHDLVAFSGGVTGTVSSATTNQLVVSSLKGLTAGSLNASVSVNNVGNAAGLVEVANVSLNADSQLAIVTQPPRKVTAGTGFSVTVHVLEANGNVDSNYNGAITLSLNGSAQLIGPITVAASNGAATFSGLAIDTAGSGYTLQASATNLTSATTNGFSVMPGPATQLAATMQPPAIVMANTKFGLAVSAEDAYGNVVSSFSGKVGLALTGGKLIGTASVAAKNGVATFSGLTIDTAANGDVLKAISGSLAVGVSNNFNVTPGKATHLVVTTQPPANVNADASFGVTVSAEDAFGNVDTSFTGKVALSSSVTIDGTTILPASAGVATYSGLSIGTPGKGYMLQASTPGLALATSSKLNVAANQSDQLVITMEPPASVVAGSGFMVVVKAENAEEQVDTHFSGTISLSLAGNAGPARLAGTTAVAVRAGVATLRGLTIDAAGGGYTLLASVPGLNSMTTNSVAVTPGAVTHLVLTTQPPASVTAGAGFGLVISAEDAYGNVNPSFSGMINLALSRNPTKALLNGTTGMTRSNGVATFSGLTINNAAAGYALTASSGKLISATTGSLTVTAGAATKLVITTQPPASVKAGSAFTVTLKAEDPFGNVDPTFGDSMSLALQNNPGNALLHGPIVEAASGGVAIFTGLTIDMAASGYTLATASANLTPATSNGITVTPAAPTQLAVTSQPPASVKKSAGFGLTITAEDAFGNVATSFTGSVSLTLSGGAGLVRLAGPTGATARAGVATFSGLAINMAANGYVLKGTARGLKATSTDGFDVTA